MKYFVLLAGGDSEVGPWDELTPEQQESEMAKHGQFAEACEERSGVEMLAVKPSETARWRQPAHQRRRDDRHLQPPRVEP